jgi:hypothetical protein
MSDSDKAKTVQVGLFESRQAAEAAVQALLAAGFSADKTSLFVQAPIQADGPATGDVQLDDVIEVGGERGAELGIAAGGLGGALAGFGLLAIPGVGPVLAIGPLAAALTGAITGGALGGFAGSLAALGVSEAEALAAELHMKRGQAVVIVETERRGEDARALLDAKGALSGPSEGPEA